MSWIRKSPFGPDDDPKDYMIGLIAREAESDGVPLSEVEMELLAERFVPGKAIPQEFLEHVKCLISRVLERQKDLKDDQRSFGAALEWVEPEYPNIAALAEEVITSGGFGASPEMHGRRLFKDRAQLVGCAVAVVVALMVIGVALSFLFDRK